MKGHGHFTCELIGDVVHTYPVSGFNEYGIQELQEAITLLVKEKESWALFEHPREQAALTPQAMIALKNAYQTFASQGCVVIVLEIGVTYGSLIINKVLNQIPLPSMVSRDVNQLTQFVSQHLVIRSTSKGL